MKLLTATAITLIGALHAVAVQPTLLDLAKARDAKVVAAQAALAEAEAAAAATNPPGKVDPKLVQAVNTAKTEAYDPIAELIGPDWRAAWETSTLADPDDILADRYMQAPFDLRNLWKGSHSHGGRVAAIIGSISVPKRIELLAHIAAKPKLVAEDVEVIRNAGVHHPSVVSRMDDIAAFLPSGGIRGEEYYQFRNTHVLRGDKSKWAQMLKVSEWFDLASQPTHFSPATFTAGRNKVMFKAAQFLISKRQAQGLPTEGPEFDVAFAPVLAALKAPKFEGLREAVAGLELPLTMPAEIDWSAQEAVAAAVQEAAERNGDFLTPWGVPVPYIHGLGSVMFVKGEAAYEKWRLETLIND